jgi:hypothetical protein
MIKQFKPGEKVLVADEYRNERGNMTLDIFEAAIQHKAYASGDDYSIVYQSDNGPVFENLSSRFLFPRSTDTEVIFKIFGY